MDHRPIRTYNILLPIWLLVWFPSWLWLILVPANYLVDRLVLSWSLGDMEGKGTFCRENTWRVCVAGFISDFAGSALLLVAIVFLGSQPGANEFAAALTLNPFANIFALLVAVAVIPFLIRILTVPIKYLIPIIIVVCCVGSFSSSYSMYGVIVMFLSGCFAYLLVKNGYPSSPMILSFVLASLLESNMRKAFIISGGSISIFFTRPITLVLMIIFFTFIAVPTVKALLKKKAA